MTDIAPAAALSGWLHPLAGGPPPSMTDRMIRALEAHVATEDQDLTDCQKLAENASDPVVRLLMGMIVEDEKRHHAVLQLMINRLHEEVDFIPAVSPLPVPTDRHATHFAEDARLPVALRTLMRDEQEGARHMRHLARRDSDVYDGLYALLLETIARDSEKHATVLRYLLRRTEGIAP